MYGLCVNGFADVSERRRAARQLICCGLLELASVIVVLTPSFSGATPCSAWAAKIFATPSKRRLMALALCSAQPNRRF